MTVKEMIEKLQKCEPDAEIVIIQGETLECTPEWWDEFEGEYGSVKSPAVELYSEDLYSHEFYLLAIEK